MPSYIELGIVSLKSIALIKAILTKLADTVILRTKNAVYAHYFVVKYPYKEMTTFKK